MSGLKVVQPVVYVVGRQEIDGNALDRFLVDHGVSWVSDSEVAAEVLTETAGRVCYQSFAKPRPGGNAAYLDHIKEVGHGSVLEHAVWNLLITGVSRSLTHELVRHRAGFGFSQLSQRYVDESVAEYVPPPDLADEIGAGMEEWKSSWHTCDFGRDEYECLMDKRGEDEDDLTEEEAIGIEWINAVATSHRVYQKVSEYLAKKAQKSGLDKTEARKFARQSARSVLPNATETKIFVTANARALRHFIEQRGSRHAEPEIRKVAGIVLDLMQKESPHLFSDYKRSPLPDGTNEITTDFPKV